MQVEMTASAAADVQDYYDQTDSLRAMLWRRAIDEGRVIVTPDPEPVAKPTEEEPECIEVARMEWAEDDGGEVY